MGMSASQANLMFLTGRMSDLELRAQFIQNDKIRLSDQSEAASRNYSRALDKQVMTVYSGLVTSNGTTTSSYINATAENLTKYGAISTTDKQRFIKNQAGQVLVTDDVATAYNANHNDTTPANFLTALHVVTDTTATGYDAAKVTYYSNVFTEIKDSGGCVAPGNANMQSSEWLTSQIEAGNIFLYTYNSEGGAQGTGDFVNVAWNSGDTSLYLQSDKTDLARAEADYEATLAAIETKDKEYDVQLTAINTEHKAIETEVDAIKKVIEKNIDRAFKIFG